MAIKESRLYGVLLQTLQHPEAFETAILQCLLVPFGKLGDDRNWRITWLCIAICGFAWLVFPAEAQQPNWRSAKLTGSYAGNWTWNKKVTFDLHRQVNELVGTYVAESETAPGKLIGKIALDGSIELREVENGNVYGTFTLRKSSAGTYEGEWFEVGKGEAYQLQLGPLAVGELPSSSTAEPQSKIESAVKRERLQIPDEATRPKNVESQGPQAATSLLSNPPVSSALEHPRTAPRNTSRGPISPVSKRHPADGHVTSTDNPTPSASFEPGPTLSVVKNEAKTAHRFSGLFEQVSAGYVVTAWLVIAVLGVASLWILANDVLYEKPLTSTVGELIAFLKVSLRGLVAAVSERLRRVLASCRSTFFSKSASCTDDSGFESQFARFLEDCDDIISFARNSVSVHFMLNYINADGDISKYYPGFIVKMSAKEIYIVETTKGLEDLDVSLKMQRLREWCEGINRVQSKVKLDFVYVDMESFEKYKPNSFRELVENFVEYKVRQSPTSTVDQPTVQSSQPTTATPILQES